jgi:hypothetical protein
VSALATIALAGALHAVPAGASATSEGEASVQVTATSSSSGTLLRGLTLPQLAALLKISPSQLAAKLDALAGPAALELEAGLLLKGAGATVGDVIDLLTGAGVSREAIASLIDELLSGEVQTPEALRDVLAEILSDLGADGQLARLAEELKLPAAVLEALQLAPATLERVSETLGTTTERLSSALTSAGVTAQPLTGSSGVVSSTAKEALTRGTTQLLGVPSSSGGVTLVTVASSAPAQSAAAASGAAAGVTSLFSVLSIKLTKYGFIVETVSLPGPGRVAVSASLARRVTVHSRHGRARTRTRTARVASIAGQESRGTHRIILGPVHHLKALTRFTLTLATTFTPAGGSSNTVRRTLVVKRRAKHKHRSHR